MKWSLLTFLSTNLCLVNLKAFGGLNYCTIRVENVVDCTIENAVEFIVDGEAEFIPSCDNVIKYAIENTVEHT